jgi:hypothetical protein
MLKLTDEQISLIEAILLYGDRVEIVPTKDGARIFRIRRNEAKPM